MYKTGIIYCYQIPPIRKLSAAVGKYIDFE